MAFLVMRKLRSGTPKVAGRNLWTEFFGQKWYFEKSQIEKHMNEKC